MNQKCYRLLNTTNIQLFRVVYTQSLIHQILVAYNDILMIQLRQIPSVWRCKLNVSLLSTQNTNRVV